MRLFLSVFTELTGVQVFRLTLNHLYAVTIGFRALNWASRETYKTGENYSVETTRLTRTETRHDFLVHGDLLRASLYGRQG